MKQAGRITWYKMYYEVTKSTLENMLTIFMRGQLNTETHVGLLGAVRARKGLKQLVKTKGK